MYALYSTVLSLALVAYLPVAAWRRRGRRRSGRSLAQRWGRIESGLPPEPRCWIHAVSVGEAAAAIPLVHAINRRWPEMSIVMTTVTTTGARIVDERVGGLATHRYFPIDLPGPVRRALEAVRPRFFIGLETELWPNFLRALATRGIPTMVANGRISDRSFRRYRFVQSLMKRILSRITVFAMQSEEDARRIIALGAPPERVVVTGNLKADLSPQASQRDPVWQTMLRPDGDRLVLVAGSTHPGEEEAVLDAYQMLRQRFAALALVLAPRHPERGAEVAHQVRDRGLPVVRRTAFGDGADGHDPHAVIVLDTVGELADLYDLADVVFVGGSLVPTGGHNMLEPAQRRKPVLFGPHTHNFRDGVELLRSAGAAVVVRDAHALTREVERLLKDPVLRQTMGDAGYAAVASRQGAVAGTVALIERHLIPSGIR